MIEDAFATELRRWDSGGYQLPRRPDVSVEIESIG
jgi:hypothetical protein